MEAVMKSKTLKKKMTRKEKLDQNIYDIMSSNGIITDVKGSSNFKGKARKYCT